MATPSKTQSDIQRPDPFIRPTDLLSILADILRLPEESLALAHIYQHRYRHHSTAHPSLKDPLDAHTLSLSALLLASKITSAPRRPLDIILPAFQILHTPAHPRSIDSKDGHPPITTVDPSSKLYDTLHRTLLHAETLLTLTLGSKLREQTAFAFPPTYLTNGLRGTSGEGLSDATPEWKDEWRIIDVMDTNLGRKSREIVAKMYHQAPLITEYPARALAASAILITMRDQHVPLPDFHENDVETVMTWLAGVTASELKLEQLQGILQQFSDTWGLYEDPSEIRERMV
ncbi:MAG: hypothetical protein M1817_002622 [Caeruleum heppii]|nr:MAG: hypothetical protein M1817_002622 [Caeruleum heppii]